MGFFQRLFGRKTIPITGVVKPPSKTPTITTREVGPVKVTQRRSEVPPEFLPPPPIFRRGGSGGTTVTFQPEPGAPLETFTTSPKEPTPTPTPPLPPVPTGTGRISDEGRITKGKPPTQTLREIRLAGGLPSIEVRRRLGEFTFKGRQVSGTEVLRAEKRARKKVKIVPPPTKVVSRSFEQTGITVPQSIVTVAPPTSAIQQKKFELEQRGGTGVITGLTSFGLGVASSISGTIQFTKSLFTKPGATLTKTFTSAKEFIKAPRETGKTIGVQLKQDPSFSLGFAAAEVATFRAPTLIGKGVVKGADVIRTRGLKEIPAKTVIAPEIARGQIFPAIKKGQTAGQLKAEFKPLLPGETKPAGFTAAPAPIKKPIVQPGTSELPGLFQAPKVSPHFLRVSSEAPEKLFSLRFKETLRPSVFRVTPTEFKLVKGVKPSQRRLASLKPTRRLIETAPKGRSTIPFIKTEKESVITAGTLLQPTRKRFFFKFEGRKIPIFEFETAKGKPPKPKLFAEKPITTSELKTRISSSRIGRRARADPLDVSRLVSSGRRVGISSRIKVPSSRVRLPSSRISTIPPSSRVIPPSSRIVTPPSSIRTPPSRRLITPAPLSRIPPLARTVRTPPIKLRGRELIGQRRKVFLRRSRKRKRVPRTPSLFAIGRGIKATAPGRFETSAITIRPILIKRRKKRGKKKKR